jgi:hypothetical protein
MMRMTQGWSGLRTAVIALGLFAGTTTGVKAGAITADPILGYNTSVSIDASAPATDGVTGSNVISFIPISPSQIDSTSNIPLGYFQVGGAVGQTTTYDNTKFSITFTPTSFDGTALNTTVTINGVLNGTVSGTNQSSVVATFTALTSGSFQVPNGTGTLSIPDLTVPLVPSSAGNGVTTVEGTLTTTTHGEVPAPEPSTIALFLSTVGGLGLRRYVLARRQRSQA